MKNLYKIQDELYIIDNNDKVTQNGIWAKCSFTGDILKNRNGQYAYKVILTTNKLLIKDGVQAIDDEFLEWFVKNPSCEEVEIINTFDYIKKGYVSHSGYNIQITKEEAKQELERGITITQVEKKSAVDWLKPQIELMLMDGYKLYPNELEETFEIAKDLENEKQGYSKEEVEVLIKTTYEETMRAMVDWFVNNKDKNQEEMESAIENYVYPRLAEKGIKFKNK